MSYLRVFFNLFPDLEEETHIPENATTPTGKSGCPPAGSQKPWPTFHLRPFQPWDLYGLLTSLALPVLTHKVEMIMPALSTANPGH